MYTAYGETLYGGENMRERPLHVQVPDSDDESVEGPCRRGWGSLAAVVEIMWPSLLLGPLEVWGM